MSYSLLLLISLSCICNAMKPFGPSGTDPSSGSHHYKSFGICNVKLPSHFSLGSDIESIPSTHNEASRWHRYKVLSFNNIVANGGRIGGRVAARNNITISGGFLIGDQVVVKPSRVTKYAFLAGHSASWNSGTLLPSSEAAYVGDHFTGPDYLQSRVGAHCSLSGCLDLAFAKAQVYYSALSNMFASLPANVIVNYQYNGIYLTCGPAFHDGPSYVANIQSSYFRGATWYSVDKSCNDNASWVMNVVGSGDMVFQGGPFPGIPEQVLYNINGTGRDVVVSTGVNGNILAPHSTFTQTTGITQGFVIVGDVAMISTAAMPSCNHTHHHQSSSEQLSPKRFA